MDRGDGGAQQGLRDGLCHEPVLPSLQSCLPGRAHLFGRLHRSGKPSSGPRATAWPGNLQPRSCPCSAGEQHTRRR